nr:serine protease inhibitor 28Dc isoform X2 [Osmia lignaria]
MTTTLMFLGLLACSYAQLIYPDDSILTRRTTVPPFPSTPLNSKMNPSTNRKVAAPYPYSTRQPQAQGTRLPQNNLGFGPAQVFSSPPVVSTFTENALQEWSDHVNDIIVNGVLKFALDMEREIYRTRGTSLIDQRDNIVFSPISLTVTLAIVLAGSAGRTFDEVSRVLGLESGVDISRNSEIVHQMFGILLTQLHSKIAGSPGPRVDFATASYVQDGYPIRSQFKALSTNVYQNEVINTDFIRNGKLAQQMINAWVKEKTMGKITSILNDVPGPETTVILLSALYFNGEWNQHFLDKSTRRKQFFVEPNEPIEVDMMYNGGPFPFYEDKQLGVKILGLPYKGHEISMYVLLPTAKGAKALRNFKNQLTVDIIEKLIGNMKNETCIIGLPRMKLTSSLELKTTLAAMGLSSLFDPMTADLSLMSQGFGAVPEMQPMTAGPTMTTPSRPGKSNTIPQNVPPSTNNVLIFSRGGEENMGHLVKRNYFTYEDKARGFTVEQWTNGFSIKKSRGRRQSKNQETLKSTNENSYSVEGSELNNSTKFVNLEGNKYRFQEKVQKERSRRQSRPIDQDFLEFVKQKNFPSFGLDKLRNSANLVNPHLFASNVLHKVEIDITEKGTEAAATTAVVLERDGSQKRLIADRPFIFFIRHHPTRLVLFWGTLNTPTPNYSVNKPAM